MQKKEGRMNGGGGGDMVRSRDAMRSEVSDLQLSNLLINFQKPYNPLPKSRHVADMVMVRKFPAKYSSARGRH